MNKVKNFILESVDEMKNKVTWSSAAELQNNTVLVLVASLIFALLIGVMDTAFKKLMEVIYNL
jgi:preprotein translocase subunit SecE